VGSGARQHQRLVDPVHCGREPTSRLPVPAERRAQREGGFGALTDRPPKGGAEVVALGVELGEVLVVARSPEHPIGSVSLSQSEVVAIVALVESVLVGGGREAFGGVGADRFEHREPGVAVGLATAYEQALGD
jgi:hypothetical protein